MNLGTKEKDCLVIVCAGDRSRHRSYLDSSSKRNFRSVILYYGGGSSNYQNDADYFFADRGSKPQLLYNFAKKNPDLLDSFQYIWIPDDDIEISTSKLNEFFSLVKEYSLAAAQPALKGGSEGRRAWTKRDLWLDTDYTHKITLWRPELRLHYVNFIEIMAPCYRSDVFQKLLPHFEGSQFGWGLDHLCTHQNPDQKFAVIDQTPMNHTRPLGSGELYQNQGGKELAAKELRSVLDANKIPAVAPTTLDGIAKPYWHPRRFWAWMNPTYLATTEAIRDMPVYPFIFHFGRKLHNRYHRRKFLRRLDNQWIPHKQEIRLFVCVRNEAARLPDFLKYYRRLGVDRFFIVDNESTDSTQPYLLDQTDVHLFSAKQSYADSRYGLKWINALIASYATGWTLCVDADEYFTYPHCERIVLPRFCRYLDEQNEDSVRSTLLDLYPRGALKDAILTPHTSPLDLCDHFESYNLHKGGVRNRVFDVSVNLQKHNLFKYSRHIHTGIGMHHTLSKKPSQIHGVTLHFKFLESFINLAHQEARREQHWAQGAEYKAYQRKLVKGGPLTLWNENSTRLESLSQLTEIGIAKSSPELDQVASLPEHEHNGEAFAGFHLAHSL